MTEQERRPLIEQVVRYVPLLQSITDEMDAAAAESLGVNHTDLRCISVLYFGGPATAKELAAAIRLTPGAFTTLLDRLEQAGYARRAADAEDRRRVKVELTGEALEAIEEIWGPVAKEAAASLNDFTTEELRIILGFLQRAIDVQVRHTARVRATLMNRNLTRARASRSEAHG